MEAQPQNHQKMRDKSEANQIGSETTSKQESQKSKQQQTPASPPSASSSPTHEFSFTISLHPDTTIKTDDKSKSKSKTPPSFAIDLSPADDIFFHGHLLPLHLLSHLPVSPRTSTNSLDSFTLPVRELLDDQNPEKISNITGDIGTKNLNQSNDETHDQVKGRTKSKSFSLFFGLQKWRKRCEVREKEEKERQKKKLKFDVSHVLKRYIRIVRPLLLFRRRRGGRRNTQFHGPTYSYSGNLGLRGKPELRGKRGEYTAPASMKNSPTNSGPLLASGAVGSSNTSDSTMEELQAAIQAAIAHCKNSIAMEDKIIKCR